MAYIDGNEVLFSATVNKTGADLAQTLEGNETDKAPSVAAVNEGLAGKLDATKQTANGHTYVYVLDYDNTNKVLQSSLNAVAGRIAMFGATSNTGKIVCSGTIGVAVPIEPYQAANKIYVDEAIEALREDIGGGSTELKAVTGHYVEGYYVPAGALPNFYLETNDFEYSTDGSGGGMYPVKFTLLQFYDASGGYIESVEAKPNTYYTMPSGTAKIVTNAAEFVDMGDDDNPDNNYDAYNVNMPYLVFQVEV